MALVELPVLFRRGSVRRSSLAETLWFSMRNLGPMRRALGTRRETRAASCPVAPEPSMSMPGNRSFKLACGTRAMRAADCHGPGPQGTKHGRQAA
jgi:hypothetical protein